jgi:hypothetical protein
MNLHIKNLRTKYWLHFSIICLLCAICKLRSVIHIVTGKEGLGLNKHSHFIQKDLCMHSVLCRKYLFMFMQGVDSYYHAIQTHLVYTTQ